MQIMEDEMRTEGSSFFSLTVSWRLTERSIVCLEVAAAERLAVSFLIR